MYAPPSLDATWEEKWKYYQRLPLELRRIELQDHGLDDQESQRIYIREAGFAEAWERWRDASRRLQGLYGKVSFRAPGEGWDSDPVLTPREHFEVFDSFHTARAEVRQLCERFGLRDLTN